MLWLCGVLNVYLITAFLNSTMLSWHRPPYNILRNAVFWKAFMALIEICNYQPEDHKLFKKVNELGVVM